MIPDILVISPMGLYVRITLCLWNAARGDACPTLKLVELVCLDLAKDKACNLEQEPCLRRSRQDCDKDDVKRKG